MVKPGGDPLKIRNPVDWNICVAWPGWQNIFRLKSCIWCDSPFWKHLSVAERCFELSKSAQCVLRGGEEGGVIFTSSVWLSHLLQAMWFPSHLSLSSTCSIPKTNQPSAQSDTQNLFTFRTTHQTSTFLFHSLSIGKTMLWQSFHAHPKSLGNGMDMGQYIEEDSYQLQE